jgi:hypothetical protein
MTVSVIAAAEYQTLMMHVVRHPQLTTRGNAHSFKFLLYSGAHLFHRGIFRRVV